MRFLADLGGTLLQKWRLGLSTLNGEGLTASRVHSLPDTSGTLATEAWVEELIAGLPRAGDLLSIEFFPGKRSALAAARPGCVPLDGTVLNRSEWPDAWEKIPEWFLVATDSNWLAGQYGYFSSGNGTTTFRLPDLNGSVSGHVRRVLRGTSGDGGGLTESAMQGHKHGSVVAAVGGATTGTPETLGPTSVGGSSVAGAYHSAGMTGATGPQTLSGSPYSDGTNGTPAVAGETRPASVDGIWIVRLANTAVNEGAVDVLELASEQVAQGVRITALENDSFTTDWLPFSVGGQLIIENLLEAVAADWAAELKCTVAQGGYLVGAEVPCLVGADSYTNAGFQITKNTSAELRVRVGSSYSVSLLNPDTGANFRTTPTSWLVRFRFWRKG